MAKLNFDALQDSSLKLGQTTTQCWGEGHWDNSAKNQLTTFFIKMHTKAL